MKKELYKWHPMKDWEDQYEFYYDGINFILKTIKRPYAFIHPTTGTEIKRTILSKPIKHNINVAGYATVALCKDKKTNNKYVHRLIAENYLDEVPDKYFVNHIDGNKSNNSIANLEWCTNAENVKHAWENGLCDANLKRTLSVEDVLQIRLKFSNGERAFEIAKEYSASRHTISDIIHRKTYKKI